MSLFVVRTRQVRPGTRIKDNPPEAPSRRIHRRAPIKTDPASLAATCRIPNPKSASQLRRIPCCHRYRFPPQPGLCPVELPSPIWRSASVVRSLNRSESVGKKPMLWRNLLDGASRGEREASRWPTIDQRTTLLRREKRATHRGSRLDLSEPSASAIFWKLRDRSLHLPTNSPRIDRILGKT